MADEGPVEGAVRSVRTLGGVAFVTLEGGGPQVVCDRQRLGQAPADGFAVPDPSGGGGGLIGL